MTSLSEQRIAQTLLDPALFSEYYLQGKIWDRQKEILHSLVTEDGKASPRIAVKAAHSSSKTFTAAHAALWFLARWQEAVVVTTAPTWGQVEKLLWGEIHSALQKSRYPFPKATLTELKIGPKRFAYGLSTNVTKEDEGVKFQGIHAEHVLIILDEAPGVDPKIWGAIEGIRAGGHVTVLAIGNPTISSGPFHDAFGENRAGWKCFTLDAFDMPNIRPLIQRAYPGKQIVELTDLDLIQPLLELTDEELDDNPCPYLTTRRWVKEKYFEWGPGHLSWEGRVRGQFPKQSEDALLSLTWLEQAATREKLRDGKCTAGVDVAGPGEAETSVTVRRGPNVVLHEQTTMSDPRGWAVAKLLPFKNELVALNVDSIGIGWNMYTHLSDTFPTAVPVNVSESSSDQEKYFNLRAEIYWGLRQRLQVGDISGLTDEKTRGQLASIRYKHNSRGQIQIESKEDAAKRGVRSPDRAESLTLAFTEKNLVYGVLEYMRQVETDMKKTQLSSLIKPTMPDNALSCPECGATCISRANGRYRCGQCGFAWAGALDKPQGLAPQVNRKDILMKVK